MSDFAQWEQENARQLGVALAGLRQGLEAAAAAGDHADAPSAAPPLTMPAALHDLGRLLGLSDFEERTLLLAAAMELDTRIAGLCARAQGDARQVFPTFALAFKLFPDAAWDVVSPERPLRFWRLIEPPSVGSQPLISAPLKADERIVNYLKGLNHLDERVSALVNPIPAGRDTGLSTSQVAVADEIRRRWEHSSPSAPLPIVQLLGTDRASKLRVADRVTASLGRTLYEVGLSALPVAAAELDLFARLWHRESRLQPVALFVDADELDGNVERLALLRRFLARSGGIFFLGVREASNRLDCEGMVVDVAKPSAAEQRAAWTQELGADTGELPGRLASQFSLNLAELGELAALARDSAESGQPLDGVAWDLCRKSVASGLDALAQRLEPRATWDDLVLPVGPERLLRQIAAQVQHRARVYGDWGFGAKMNRGFGISALFAGESGTGKTMAAEVLAHDLQLNLYRIDLSAVVNKYIGETEKNLRRLFDAAEDGGAILFFDEADALFGKRTEVSNSHDRYANIEINYLLQRLESYRGLAILATNFKSALDGAFLRRLRFVVQFPFPGLPERRQLWEKAFPQPDPSARRAGVPVHGLDVARLARFDLAGGHIHNIALNAAFRAAATGSPVSMPLVLESVRDEFVKLERPVNAADFQWIERNGCTRPRVLDAPHP